MPQEILAVTILIVDDDQNIRFLINQILTKEGYQIVQAASGEEAVELIETNNFELVITDLQMFELSGIEVLKAAKARDPFTEVLILTGYGDIKTAVKAIKLGAYEYLSKPVNRDEFRVKVLKALEQRELKQQIDRQQQKIREFNEMIASDLKLATQVQATLVPTAFRNGRVEVAVCHLPMIGIGGDLADIYFDRHNNLYLTLIDVTGHGITAALIVNRLSTEVHRLVRDGKAPAQIISTLNDFLLANLAQTGLFLTMFSVQIDVNLKKMTFAGAAHPAMLVWRQNSTTLERLYSQNTIVGFHFSSEANFRQNETGLAAGDKLILYTDGIIESENKAGRQFGTENFINLLIENIQLPAQLLTDCIVREIRAFCEDNLKDDIYLMVAEIK